MRLRAAYTAGLAVLASALAPIASAQIISTSVPYADRGISAGKSFTFHVMASPFAKWKYGEVYIGEIDTGVLTVGSVNATPNSDFLLAAEVGFALGEDSPWSMTLGGWYNKVGATDYALAGTFLVDLPFPFNVGDISADVGGDLSLYEGHVGFFYKDFGIQAGIVKTTGEIGTTASNVRIVFTAAPDQPADLGDFDVAVFESDTTDWDVFGVYKAGGERWNAAIGAGVYGKQGIASGSPLRNAEDKTVFSAFVSANVAVWQGLTLDASYWFIGSTGTVEGDLADLGAIDSDSQNRLTFGIGYTF